MLSRSSWRAARVLRAARTGGGQQQQQSQPSAPASSTADTRTKIPAVAAACTCSRNGQKRRFSATERFRELDELFQTKHTSDLKGKGRAEQQNVQPAIALDDHIVDDRNEGTSSGTSTASRYSTLTLPRLNEEQEQPSRSSQSFAQQHQALRLLLDNTHENAIEKAWATFRRMTEEEQKELPASTLSKLASLQKSIPLEQRGMLWMRLNRIYAAWPAHKMHILRRGLLNTMRLLRDWFEQKEVPQKSVHFSQARSFCVQLGTYLRPYEDAKLVEELADLLHDYGSTDNIADFADDQGIKLFSYVKRPKDSDRSDVLCKIISKLASSLALRRRTKDAIILLGRAAPERILHLETGSSRDILLSLLAMELEEPESALEARNELEVCAKSHLGGTEASFGQLLATFDEKSKEMAEMRRRGKVDIVSLIGGDIAEVSLSYLKSQMRTLLLEPKISPDIPSAEVKRTKEILFLYNAMEALFLYEQFLSKGFRADRELYRIARMARKRTGTHSNFSFDLREAAHLRVQELRRREVLNFKKRWQQPKPDIAGRWIEPRIRERTALGVHVEQGAAGTRDEAQSPAQLTSPETSEASTVIAASPAGSETVNAGGLDMRATAEPTAIEEVTISAEAMAVTPVVAEVTQQSIPLDVPRANIYANATLGQVLRLAIEIGDNDLARAAFQAVREDPTFTWTLDDSDRVSSLLDLLIADASRTDLTWMAQQNAIQLACSFYTKWRGDVYLSTGPSFEQEERPRNRWRAPTLHILRLLASQEKAFGFVSTFKALLSDPSVTLTAEHLERYLRVAVQHGALSWIGFKLHLTRETLRRGRHTSHLVKELDHALASTYSKGVSVYHRSYFRWCDAVLRQISRLGIAQDYHLFKHVVAVYNGTSIAEEGSPAQMIVDTLKKENIAPTSKQDTLYLEARMLSMSSDDLRLLKLIRAKELVQVAPDITERVSELARNGNRLYASKLFNLFSAFAEEDEHAEGPEVVDAIESMKEVFLQTRKMVDQLSRRRVLDTEVSYSTSSNIPMDVSYRVSTAKAAGRTGFLSNFFTEDADLRDAFKSRSDDSEAAYQPSSWQAAPMGFPNAVGPETVQAAAATCNSETSSGDEVEQNGRCGIGKRKSLGLAYIGTNLMPGQAYSTLAAQPNFFGQNGQGRLSLLHELSHLPQQFAELTLDQIYALKKRCEEEFQAVRRRDQEAQLARKIALKRSRADATRWHGWQEFQAIPWY